jgi:ABC-2 type transport system permease protein
MLTIFRYSLARMRGQILGWGLGMGILGAYLVTFYDVMAPQQEQLMTLLKSYPPELMVFFGDMNKIFTPSGFLHVEFFSYMSIILGIFSVLAGSGMLAGDEESGTLDLVLAHPVSRAALFFGRLLALLVATVAILALIWLGFILAAPSTQMGLTAGELALPFLSLFAVMMLFAALALMLSMLLPSRRLAAMITGLLLVASFFITALAKLDDKLENVAKFSPLNYYQGGEAIESINWGWIMGLLGTTLVFALLAWWSFERRDVRVGGEGGWGLPGMSRWLRRVPIK